MLDKNSKQHNDLLQKRQEYGRNLFNNAIAGRLNFKETIIPEELKQKDFEKIAKDVMDGIIVLNREFPKIEKEYTKFCNEIQIEKQKLEKQNKKLNKEKNNIGKKHEDLYCKLENCDLEIQTLNDNKQEYLELQQQLEIYKKNQTQQIQKNIKDKEQAFDNKIKELKLLEERENNLFEDYNDKKGELLRNKECLEDFREKLKNKKQQLEELENDKLQLIEKYDETYNKKINELYVNDFKNFKQNDIIKNTIKEKYAPTLKNLLVPINGFEKKIMVLKIEYNKLEQQRDNLIKASSRILNSIDDISKQLDYIETEKQHLNNEIATIEQGMFLSKQQRNKMNNEYEKQSKEYQSNIEAIDKILTDKQSIFYRLEKQHERFIDLNTKRVEHINQQIWNNNTQITQLDEKINERTKKYNNIKNAYNRAFGLYNKQNKQINNNNNVIVKKYLPKYR